MGQKRLDYLINLGLAGIAGLGGCVASSLTVIALIAGLFLDNQIGTGSIFTLVCIIGSVPFSLVVTIAMVYRSAKTIQKRQFGTK